MQVNSASNNPEHPHTMENLGIKEGSIEASIFNKIDMEDKKKDDALTEKQYEKYIKIKSILDESKGRLEKVKNFFSHIETNFPDTLVVKNSASDITLAELTEENSPENPEESDAIPNEPEEPAAKPKRKKVPNKTGAKPINVTKNRKEVKYTEKEKKLIEDMKKSIDTINNSEVDFSTGGRKFDLGKTEKLLQEAKKSTNLNKTDEYKE